MRERDFLEDEDLSLRDEDHAEETFTEEPDTSKAQVERANDDELLRFRREKEETERLLEEERQQRFNAERMAVKASLENMERNREVVRTEIRDLKAELEVAKQEGDTDRIRRLSTLIDDKEELRSRIHEDLKKYSPLLEQDYKPTKVEKAPISKAETLQLLSEKIPAFREWYGDNRSWMDDPLHHKKRKRAETLMEEYYKEGYDLHSAKFYKAIDHQLQEEFESKTKRSQPVMRGEINGANSSSIKRSNEDANLERMASKLADKLMKDKKLPSNLTGTDQYQKMWKTSFETSKKLLKQYNVKSLNDIVFDI